MSLGLAMIVRDEANVIERCLASVRPFVSHWTIVDTGSSDDTTARAARALAGLPGAVHARPWRDFGHNRTEMMALARDRADYTLVVDADDVLVASPGFVVPRLELDAYTLRIDYGETTYWRPQIFRNALPWRYEGVLHEYATCDREVRQARLPGLSVRVSRDGARSREPERYSKDAAILRQALEQDPGNARHAFYLAQSLRDAGDLEGAIAAYARRAAMGGFEEEVFVSLLQRARLMERAGRPRPDVWAAYLMAHQVRPRRAEALCDLARYCREGGELAIAHMAARQASMTPEPDDVLFLEPSAYRWRALDELAVSAFHSAHYEESAAASARLLTEGRLPASEVERVRKNFALVADRRKP
jgi:tetratricopeptide (TPR) repeat protein